MATIAQREETASAAVMREREAEPTWRDVVRTMRAAGFRLIVEEREDGGYRKWWVDEGTGGIVAEVWREVLGGRYTWTVEVNAFLRSVCLDNPGPADVLAAAMLTRLIEGPVCGVEIVGLGDFTPEQPKHTEL